MESGKLIKVETMPREGEYSQEQVIETLRRLVSTGVLPIRTAILIAAVLNFGGALLGTAVAAPTSTDDPE